MIWSKPLVYYLMSCTSYFVKDRNMMYDASQASAVGQISTEPYKFSELKRLKRDEKSDERVR